MREEGGRSLAGSALICGGTWHFGAASYRLAVSEPASPRVGAG